MCYSVCWRLWGFRNLLDVLEVPEVIRCLLLCMLEVVELSKFDGGVGRAGRAGGDALCATLYAGRCGGWARFAEMTRCMLLWLLEAEEVMRCAIRMLEIVGFSKFAGRTGGAGGDTLRATLYAGGCGVFEICWRCWTCWTCQR